MTSGLLVSAIVACFVGGLLPWINGEVFVGAAAAVLSAAAFPVLIVACTTSHLAAKSALYALVRWAPDRLPRRALRSLERARRLAEGRPRRTVLMLVLSAAAGLPPFYLVTLAAGAVRVPFAHFLAAGGAGLMARYAVVVWSVSALSGHLPNPFS